MAAVVIDDACVRHIFRNAAGHFREDTPGNRQALTEMANRAANFVGTDRFGYDCSQSFKRMEHSSGHGSVTER